ncbi:glycoside hydrolase family 32 protein [Mucilaginibacter aquariorum]|uniref:Glycoside hydrolase family 32 protein n=1 Tax=Mucilaginibacter aquariorum TaxID=2967225 RepID=A0ABT1T8J1_9SPHI|nr:glycoside hydrolase family 32 protein [Mucilaginibacter aquariorum]MCQ6960757.1 glycoside hydrolase family 32 protein [Mucilaginibacter aquariorum]
MLKVFSFIAMMGLLPFCSCAQDSPVTNKEKHRPQIHFTPERKWMNDPNGMVYYKGKYHLFYQFYPGGTKWGPMHWAHATSKDLVHWERLPVALYPDSLGYIFSGSAVVDAGNTSGFGKDGKTPLVAIFTHHNPKAEKAGRSDSQNQSIAYSLDEGQTWTKYSGNPVLKNPGISDFRDPKVSWYAAQKKWIMTLATKDRITFYSSPDLKSWTKESEFGERLGAHGGVWECPDLFPLSLNGKKYYVLLISINPGAPNGGSGTQYFIGDFDGSKFTPLDTATRWIDYGTDNYAGITWANTGGRKVFIGWMNNWTYANQVPTEEWRGATTLPRELRLINLNNRISLRSEPVAELSVLDKSRVNLPGAFHAGSPKKVNKSPIKGPYKVQLQTDRLASFSVVLSNKDNNQLLVGYDKGKDSFFIDRTAAGPSEFNKEFAKIHYAPRISKGKTITLTLFVDVASVELFADNGLTVMTDVFFPDTPLDVISVKATTNLNLKNFSYTPLKTIW